MVSEKSELPSPQEQEEVDGDDRERLVKQVLEKTDLSKVDQHIRNKGYVRDQSIVHRELYPDYSFDLLTVTLKYHYTEKLATATWKGVPPDRLKANQITYNEIYDEIGLEEALENSSLDKRRVLPLVVGFIDNGQIGIRLTSNGIEETEVDTEGMVAAAKNTDWDEHDC